jgi:hypothetical protein
MIEAAQRVSRMPNRPLPKWGAPRTHDPSSR